MIPLHCGSLLQRWWAIPLGQSFATSFASSTLGLGKGEIALFREMKHSLLSIAKPPHVVVEEYHGGAHQVRFTGTGTYARAAARCELSDMMVVAYDRKTKDARLTYIQVKSERTVAANANGIAGKALSANLEQWHLLAIRPSIAGVGSFTPPADLLSSARLCSIGSFAFFLHGASGVDIYYAAAPHLHMPSPYTSRSGKLTAVGDACCCRPEAECVSVYGNAEFGAFLFGLMIGTPILSKGKSVASIGTWLAAQLRGFATVANDNVDLARELADLLDPDQMPPAAIPNVGAAFLLLLGVGPADGRTD